MLASQRIECMFYGISSGDQSLTLSQAWKKLAQHHKELSKDIILREYFKKDPQRFQKFSHVFKNEADGTEIVWDFSKNFLNDETLPLLVKLAKEANLEQLRDDMFAGKKINFTEDRAVLHVALRNRPDNPIEVDGQDVMPGVTTVLDKMRRFSEALVRALRYVLRRRSMASGTSVAGAR